MAQKTKLQKQFQQICRQLFVQQLILEQMTLEKIESYLYGLIMFKAQNIQEMKLVMQIIKFKSQQKGYQAAKAQKEKNDQVRKQQFEKKEKKSKKRKQLKKTYFEVQKIEEPQEEDNSQVKKPKKANFEAEMEEEPEKKISNTNTANKALVWFAAISLTFAFFCAIISGGAFSIAQILALEIIASVKYLLIAVVLGSFAGLSIIIIKDVFPMRDIRKFQHLFQDEQKR